MGHELPQVHGRPVFKDLEPDPGPHGPYGPGMRTLAVLLTTLVSAVVVVYLAMTEFVRVYGLVSLGPIIVGILWSMRAALGATPDRIEVQTGWAAGRRLLYYVTERRFLRQVGFALTRGAVLFVIIGSTWLWANTINSREMLGVLTVVGLVSLVSMKPKR